MNAEMPCPNCEAPLPGNAAHCPACGASRVVCGRYELRELLGRGGMGVVYGAVRRPDGAAVAVKVLSLASGADWSTRELFERSTRVLQGLRHPALPRVLDFEEDEAGKLLLIRERFDGGSLDERIRLHDRRVSPAELRGLLVSGLRLLAYLQGLVPPVVHRDIKPANIFFRTREDWSPVLVDFDTVAAPAAKRSGFTIAGTPGFAAPEQLLGEATPASDVYGLGMTVLYVATHLEPAELPRKKGRLDVEKLLGALDEPARRVLLKMVEPEVARRFATAAEAIEELEAASRPREAEEPRAPRRIGVWVTLALAGLFGAIAYGVMATQPARRPGMVQSPPVVTPLVPLSSPEPLQPMPVPEPVVQPAPPTPPGSAPVPKRSRRKKRVVESPALVLPTRGVSAPARPESTFRRGACRGLLDCYDKAGVYGAVSGRVVSEIGADGRAGAVRYEAGQAPEAVKRCLFEVARSRRIEGFWGEPGELACEYVGQYVKGAPVVSFRRSFRRF